MTKVFELLLAAMLLAGVPTSPILVQTPTNQVTTTTADMGRYDNTGKWSLPGLLGLLGLLGLINMRKNEKPRTYTTTNTSNR